jgi:hypothetical protein
MQTLGYGTQIKLLRSKPGYEFDVLAGSSLEKKLIAFDGKQVPLFILDDQSNVWGVQDADGNFLWSYLHGGLSQGNLAMLKMRKQPRSLFPLLIAVTLLSMPLS